MTNSQLQEMIDYHKADFNELKDGCKSIRVFDGIIKAAQKCRNDLVKENAVEIVYNF